MDYYEKKDNVEQYVKFTPSHDGAFLVDLLAANLPAGSSVLEIGIGPGKDFEKLSRHFRMTGSDLSQRFLDRYRAHNADAELLRLDARTLEIERTFDGIFSNKALIHMSDAELRASFARQHEVLNDGGLMLHSFWHGKGEQEFGGLTLIYHNEDDLAEMLDGSFDIVEIGRHAKMDDDDSVYVLARKKS
jgi:cyclopropane fatty-acyl-phospholipid synthase-like methyltransferase